MNKIWSKFKSVAKAKLAAYGATIGGVIGGVSGTGVVTFIHSVGVEWPAALDPSIAAAITALGAVLGTAYKVYTTDKAKHGGNL